LTHLLHLVAATLGSSQLSSALRPCLLGLDLRREEGAGSSRYQIRGVRTDHREGEEQGAAWTRERRRGAEPGNRRRIEGGRRRPVEPAAEGGGVQQSHPADGGGIQSRARVRERWGREGDGLARACEVGKERGVLMG
jgi:hypothetical protein